MSTTARQKVSTIKLKIKNREKKLLETRKEITALKEELKGVQYEALMEQATQLGCNIAFTVQPNPTRHKVVGLEPTHKEKILFSLRHGAKSAEDICKATKIPMASFYSAARELTVNDSIRNLSNHTWELTRRALGVG
jgi:hypothetical protein